MEHLTFHRWYIDKVAPPFGIEIDADIEGETTKAIRLTTAQVQNYWVPKSAVKYRTGLSAAAGSTTPSTPGDARGRRDTATVRIRVDDSRTSTPVLRVVARGRNVQAHFLKEMGLDWGTDFSNEVSAREAAFEFSERYKDQDRHYATVVEFDIALPVKGGANDDDIEFDIDVPTPAPTLRDLADLVIRKNGEMTKVLKWVTDHYGQWSTIDDDRRRDVMAALEAFPAAPPKVRKAVITFDQDGFVRVRCEREDNDLVKAVGEAWWDGKMTAWRFRPSVGVATSLLRIFPRECFSEAMLRMADPASAAKAAKEVEEEDVPDHPTSGPPSWTHQKKAYNVAFPLPAAGIFMEMATGKTKVVVDLFCNREHKRGLVVCPKKALEDHVWQREFALHSTKDVMVIELTGKLVDRVRQVQNTLRHQDVVYVAEYQSVWMDPLGAALLKAGLDLVVWDEGHRLSSPGSQISTFASRMERTVPWRIITTGTKIRQRPLNVYGMYRALDRGIFGNSVERFKEKYVVMGGYEGREILGYQNEEEFAERLFSIAYEVKTDDVLDLPPFTKLYHYFSLSGDAKKAYTGMRKNKVAHVGSGTSRANSVLVRDLRSLQICSGYLPMDDGSVATFPEGKASELKTLFDDLDNNEPTVIFANWHPEMDDIHQVCARAGRSSGELSGRANDIERWRNGEITDLVVQYESGSEALSMVRARHMIYYALSRSMFHMTQSAFRIRRPGQGRDCIFHFLIAKDTIEEDVLADIETLESDAAQVVDAVTKRNGR